jgi:hypothetical protein
VLIGVVGDFKPGNVTHETLNASLAHAGADSEWIATDAMPPRKVLSHRYAGFGLLRPVPIGARSERSARSGWLASVVSRSSALEAGSSTYWSSTHGTFWD